MSEASEAAAIKRIIHEGFAAFSSPPDDNVRSIQQARSFHSGRRQPNAKRINSSISITSDPESKPKA